LALIFTFSPTKIQHYRLLLKAKVPKLPHNLNEIEDKSEFGKVQDIQNFKLIKEDLSKYTTVSLNMADGVITFNQTICSGKFCCNFKLDWIYIQFPSAPEIVINIITRKKTEF
jgi:hypothetical protein